MTYKASDKLSRCRERYLEFEFDIVHSAGIKHEAADAISSLPTDGADNIKLNDDILVLAITTKTTKTTNTDKSKPQQENWVKAKELTE